MLKFDLKDKKIITVLDENARTPLSKIASKVGLSKQVIEYRIKSLVKKGIIRKFTINCDLTKLGYSTFGVYLRLNHLTEKREKEIISMLTAHPFTRWVVVCEGKWDMAFALSAKNIIDFNQKLEEILTGLGANLENYETNIIFSMQNFYLDLLEKKEYYKAKPLRNEFTTENTPIKIDALDFGILQELQKDARASLVSIATKTKSTADVVRYRIKNMLEKKIIIEFKITLDYNVLGYNWYQLIIDLNRFPEEQKKKFMEKMRAIPHISYMVNCIGKWDFEIHIHAESNEEFRKVLLKIRDELAEFLVSYDTFIIFSKHKSAAIPEGVAEELITKAEEDS